MRRFRFVFLFASLLVTTVCAAQQQATAKHNVNLRRDPSTHNPPISLLLPGEVLQLVETDQTNSYYHVHTSDGTDGWVWARNVTIQAPSNSGGGGSPDTPETAISTSWDKPAPVSNTLLGEEGSCGQTGDGGDTDTNLRKNRVDVPSNYHLVTWDAINSLQYPNAPHSRMQWTADQLAEITPYEGVAVSAVGYLYNVKVESRGSGESTNCHFTKPADVDWHMYFVRDAGGGEAVAVIAETTPRVRQNHPNWDVAKLKPWTGTGASVRLSGWLMLDPEHPDVVGKYRGTIWEIHPVTKIEVQQHGTWVDADSLQ
jgi:uncharacterized protein YgiM (DUF1202 family)